MQSTQSFFLEVFSVTLIWGVIFLVWWFLHKRSEERCNTESIKLDADAVDKLFSGAVFKHSYGELSSTPVIKETPRDLLDQVKSLESLELQKILCNILAGRFLNDYYLGDDNMVYLACGSVSFDLTKEFESFRESLYADSDDVKDEEV